MVISGHNLIRVRRQTTPTIPTSCFFTIPEEYKTCHVNHDRLLLHDSDDLQSQINNSLYSQPEGRVLIWSSDVQLNLLQHRRISINYLLYTLFIKIHVHSLFFCQMFLIIAF